MLITALSQVFFNSLFERIDKLSMISISLERLEGISILSASRFTKLKECAYLRVREVPFTEGK